MFYVIDFDIHIYFPLRCFLNNFYQLYISKPFEYAGNGHDKELSMSILAQFGVPTDGVFKIEEQTSAKLVLSSNETGIITLRKY